MPENILEIRGLNKYFGPVKVLNNVDITIKRGEIHGLVGANGSGKSTLLNILFGNSVIKETSGYRGEIYIEGKKVNIKNTKDSLQYGIGMIHQEFALIPDMTIAENIKLSRENTKGFLDRIFTKDLSFIDKKQNRSDASRVLKRLGLTIDTDILVNKLSTNAKQFIEIAREIDKDYLKILILDEPTAVLNKPDSEKLLAILKELSAKGTSIIFVTHRLDEICQVCDRVTVLRDGTVVSCYNQKDLNIKKLARDMIGGEIIEAVARKKAVKNEVILSFHDFKVEMPGESLKGLDMDIYDGEIVGITSLSGHGKLALGYGVIGFYPTDGKVIYHNKELKTSDTRKNINDGIYFLPDDRKGLGLLPEHSIEENIIFSGFQLKNQFSRGFCKALSLVEKKAAFAHVDNYIQEFDIKCKNKQQKVKELSGGNQQKICIARALTVSPKVLFISEPTRGVDIGAKEKLLNMLVEINEKSGTTIIIASSELDELKRICDRIVILSEGKIAKILPPTAHETEFALAISGEGEGA
ncbi:MAG: sugar ABC transporter ATP-binding protein [Bacillota bacterium]|jgi:simple sugar transport system ATP-binding protein